MLFSLIFSQPQLVDHGGVTFTTIVAVTHLHLTVGLTDLVVIFELLQLFLTVFDLSICHLNRVLNWYIPLPFLGQHLFGFNSL